MTTTGSGRLALAEHWLRVGRPANTPRELDSAVSRDGLALRGRAHLQLGNGAQVASAPGAG